MIGIEDVTDRAAKLREVLGKNPVEGEEKSSSKETWEEKEKAKKEEFTVEQLIELGVMPREVEYVLDEEVRAHLRMDGGNDS